MIAYKVTKSIPLESPYVSRRVGHRNRTSIDQISRDNFFFTMGDFDTNGAKQAVNYWGGIHMGKLQLEHRVVMSPLTRARCPAGLPSEINVEYYSQRATKGGLLISEGIHPSIMVSVTGFARLSYCSISD